MTMALLLTVQDVGEQPALVFHNDFRQIVYESDPFRRYREAQSAFRHRDIGDQMSLIDMTVHLPDVFLEKVDRATMAASVEVRVPFLDEDLVEYVSQLPSSLKIPGGRKKWLLKQCLKGIVPSEVLTASKTGFGVPYEYWLRTSLKPFFFDHLETFLLDHPRILDESTIRTWYRETETLSRNHAFTLWNILNFMVWVNTCDVSFDTSSTEPAIAVA
jgi:asparagine synthase (glutamine-hydrolysing)